MITIVYNIQDSEVVASKICAGYAEQPGFCSEPAHPYSPQYWRRITKETQVRNISYIVQLTEYYYYYSPCRL